MRVVGREVVGKGGGEMSAKTAQPIKDTQSFALGLSRAKVSPMVRGTRTARQSVTPNGATAMPAELGAAAAAVVAEIRGLGGIAAAVQKPKA